jgi:GT2 family glycosyltransferase
MYNVFIGMPTGGTIKVETVTSLIGAMDLLKQKDIDVGLSCMVGGYVAHNRNNLVREARKKKATHLMFIDADHVFPPASIIRLLDHDKDIVAANYNTRGNLNKAGQLLNVLKPFDENGEMDTSGATKHYEMPKTLFKVAGIGTGFMLIKMSVFDSIDAPWFVAWEGKDGEHHTEDIDFCVKAREAGFDIWCSPTIQIGHIGTQQF